MVFVCISAQVFVFGGLGTNLGTALSIQDDFWVYKVVTNTWRLLNDVCVGTLYFASSSYPRFILAFLHSCPCSRSSLIPLPPPLSAGGVPSGRYGHSMDVVGALIYMFGGTTAAGHSDELWTYDQALFTWSRIRPAFKGALWPMRRVFHSTAVTSDFLTTDGLAVIETYKRDAHTRAAAIFSQFTSASSVRHANAF